MTEKKLEQEHAAEGQGGTAEAEKAPAKKPEISETWAEETIADLDDFIESQGIYIRQ